MGAIDYVVKVREPVLTLEEASEAIGRLTQTCESLRADIVALEEQRMQRVPSLKTRIKAWLRARLDE